MRKLGITLFFGRKCLSTPGVKRSLRNRAALAGTTIFVSSFLIPGFAIGDKKPDDLRVFFRGYPPTLVKETYNEAGKLPAN